MLKNDFSFVRCGHSIVIMFYKSPFFFKDNYWRTYRWNSMASEVCFKIILECHLEQHGWTCMLIHFSRVWFSATPWTVAHQTPLSMGFFRQEYWSGLPRLSYWVKQVRQRRRNIVWHPFYAESRKKWYKWTYLQNRNRLRD